MQNSTPAQPLDTPERVLDFPLTGTRLIEASAGTGKTYTIANLYLRQVGTGLGVGDLLVVTFTEAATDELRGRIRARLAEALALLDHPTETDDAFLQAWFAETLANDPNATARRLRLAVRSMDEAAIYTIHGFCQRALTEFAFNSGQQFRMEVLTDDGDLWRAALQDWWRRTGYPLRPAQARLFQAACGAFDAFAGLCGPLLQAERRVLLPHVKPLARVFERLEAAGPTITGLAEDWARDGERLRQILRTSKGLSRGQKSPYQPHSLEAAFVLIDTWFAACATAGEPLPPPEAFAALGPQSFVGHTLKKADPALDDPYFKRCGTLWDQLGRLRRDLRAAALGEAADFARQQVLIAKQRAQVLGFDDLLTELQRALNPNGGQSSALAEAIRRRFPAVMIDEFQDTDPIQYGIFRHLYVGRPEVSLIMIGDPKQAIYSFRGGDIFTYMQAKADLGPGALYTLGTNWRSTPQVINAVNRVFDRRAEDAFVYGASIPFAPVQAADKPHQSLWRDAAPQPALTLWHLPVKQGAKGQEKGLSKDDARDMTHAAVAQEVAQLIREGRAGLARLAPVPGAPGRDEPLRPKHIAILVRSAYEATGVREALARLGVAAVSVERTGVFASPEAAALAVLLAAVLDPRDRDLARLALTSPLLGKTYSEVEAIIQGEDAWAVWQDNLLLLQETWQRRGFMAMFQAMLQRLGLAQALARDPDAERRLTNLLHLGELLQQASKTQAGLAALLGWYRGQLALARDGRGGDEAGELRLESDAELVQIITIHSSKGLEYPVVFVPYLWACKVRDTKGLVAFHRGGEALLDAGSDEIDANQRLAERERLAEDVRLAYVALTRARSALYLVWGRAGSQAGHAGQTALAWLLHPRQSADQLSDQVPDAFAGLASLEPDLAALAAAAQGDIDLAPLPEADRAKPLEPTPAKVALAPRALSNPVSAQWRATSFSELTRNVHPGPTPPRDPQARDPAARFPAGSHAGSYLHLLLELTDFRGDVYRQALDLSERYALRFGIDHSTWGSVAAEWLERVTRTPLNDDGLSLASLAPSHCLNELEFDFATARVDMGALNSALQAVADGPVPPLDAEAISGLVTGVIDLVFEHGGRYYIADYKSNYLGPSPGDYTPERLAGAIRGHRYDLQSLLYTLALHRYLRGRILGYDYQRHFGGSYYLFLRGMHPDQGPGSGVHFSRPDTALVEALDRDVFRWEGVAGPPGQWHRRMDEGLQGQ